MEKMDIRPARKPVNHHHRNSELGKKDRICRKLIEYGLLGVIIFSPLPAASVGEWAILVIQMASLAMIGAYILMGKKPHNNPYLSRSLKWPRFLFGGLFLFIIVQIIPWPKFLVKILSPSAYAFQENFSPAFSQSKFMSFSLVPAHSLREGLELLSYVFIGFLIVKTVTRSQQIRKIVYTILIMGTFEAAYGLFEIFRDNPRILFYKKVYHQNSVSGTFVNRNHLSGYLELIIPLALGLVISRIDFSFLSQKKWMDRFIHLFRKEAFASLLVTLSVIIMSLGIVFSSSRSGVFLLLFTFLLFIELTVIYFSMSRYRLAWIKKFLKGTFVIVTLLSLFVGMGKTIQRFQLDELLQGGRPIFWSNVTGMIGQFPLLGTGLGTFAAVYPAFEKVGFPGLLSHAHNDYLEYLSELGLIGTAILLGGVLFIIVRSFLVWVQRRNAEVKGLGLGGLIALLVMMIHSITDFNLHIPANALLFSVILSLTYVTVHHGKARTAKNAE